MIAIIRWTLWQRRWSIMWWSLGVVGFLLLNLVFYPSFKDQAAELQKTFQDLPDTAVQFFGGSADFFSPVGFLNSQIYFLMLPLLLGILAIGMGTSLIGREEQDTTLETLLAHPISRSRLLAAKAMSGLIILTFVTLISFITVAVAVKLVDLIVPTSYIAEASFACFVLCLCFGAVAFLITSLGRARVASLGLTALVALGGYVISSLAGTVDWLKIPAKAFPFHYYQPENILRGSFAWSNVIILAAATAVLGFLSWYIFRRRDLA